jgi:hypothetical protein
MDRLNRIASYLFFAFMTILFLWDLIVMKGTFISGDYSVQFYPWSIIYSEAIKNFQFPFWTKYFHSGFPLMAEGQIGGFYPLNILIFFMLPFKWAYNYSVVLHFILAAIFTYLYAKKLGAERWGGALAVLCFCFGSAYAGCFYNIVTLKTLAWFPLVLFLIENFFESKKTAYLISAAIIAGVQFLAGFFQMAVYAFGFYLIYMFYGFRLYRVRPTKALAAVSLFVLISFAISLPQFLLSYQLTRLTGRAEANLDFALWGSFLPPCLLSIIFPRMGFIGPKLYISVLGIFFLIYAAASLKTKIKIRPIALIGIAALFLSLGRYNPIYVMLIRLSGLYSFRNPSKFLFFAAFCGSVLCGIGLSEFFQKLDRKRIAMSKRIFYMLVAFSISAFFIARAFCSVFKDRFTMMLQDYTAKNIFGRPHHRYSLEAYMEKARSVYMILLNSVDPKDIFNILSFVIIAVSLIAVLLFVRSAAKKSLKSVAIFIIFADLYIYSFYGTGFRGNIKPFNFLAPKEPMILRMLKTDKGPFRVLPFDLTEEDMPLWLRPNANIIVRIDSIAAYTPLALADYKNGLLDFEVVNDSLGLISPKAESFHENTQALRLLNVKYIISKRIIANDNLHMLVSENGIFLYRFNRYLPRIFFTRDIEKDIKEEESDIIKSIKYREGLAEIEINAKYKGYLIFSETYYPGWHVYVDGKEYGIIRVKNLIQAVGIEKGPHRVVFKFKPKFL